MDYRTPTELMQRDRFMRLPAVERYTGVKKSFVYAAMKAGTFPQAVRLSSRCVAWRESEIQQWMAQRIAESQMK